MLHFHAIKPINYVILKEILNTLIEQQIWPKTSKLQKEGKVGVTCNASVW